MEVPKAGWRSPEKKALIDALADEKRRIQEALLAVGYFAHTVKFRAEGPNAPPRVEIEAWMESDDELERLGFKSQEAGGQPHGTD
jgi:hypothetical protein